MLYEMVTIAVRQVNRTCFSISVAFTSSRKVVYVFKVFTS